MANSNPNPNGAARWDESFLEARAGLPSDMAQVSPKPNPNLNPTPNPTPYPHPNPNSNPHSITPTLTVTLTLTLPKCPDVFVNINYINASTKGKTKRLGYIRRTMAGCYGFNHAQQWTSLERDPSYPEVPKPKPKP